LSADIWASKANACFQNGTEGLSLPYLDPTPEGAGGRRRGGAEEMQARWVASRAALERLDELVSPSRLAGLS
jgi:hypothetical protein